MNSLILSNKQTVKEKSRMWYIHLNEEYSLFIFVRVMLISTSKETVVKVFVSLGYVWIDEKWCNGIK